MRERCSPHWLSDESPEPDYSIFETPERSLEQIAKIQAEMVKGEFTPPKPDWKYLPRTRRILTAGGDLHVLALGDSIVADTMRSGWLAKLGAAYPQAKIRGTVYVRGGGGCQHYKEEGRIAKNIVPRKPDLVFIGGISQRDIEAIRDCIHQLRAGLPEVEILLATGAFGSNADPRDAADLAKAPHSGTGAYGEKMRQLAADERCRDRVQRVIRQQGVALDADRRDREARRRLRLLRGRALRPGARRGDDSRGDQPGCPMTSARGEHPHASAPCPGE